MRTRSGPQTASHGLVFVVYVGDEAGAIPSRPRRRARTAKPRHYRPEIHISFSTKVDQAARGRPLVITSDNRCGRLVIKSDNKTAGRHPLPCHDLDHRGIAKPSPRRKKVVSRGRDYRIYGLDAYKRSLMAGITQADNASRGGGEVTCRGKTGRLPADIHPLPWSMHGTPLLYIICIIRHSPDTPDYTLHPMP